MSRFEHIKIFHPWRLNMYILPPFMDEVLSEELVKKDNEMGGNIPGRNFLGGNFPGDNFPGGSLMGGNFPGGNFPRTVKKVFLKI